MGEGQMRNMDFEPSETSSHRHQTTHFRAHWTSKMRKTEFYSKGVRHQRLFEVTTASNLPIDTGVISDNVADDGNRTQSHDPKSGLKTALAALIAEKIENNHFNLQRRMPIRRCEKVAGGSKIMLRHPIFSHDWAAPRRMLLRRQCLLH